MTNFNSFRTVSTMIKQRKRAVFTSLVLVCTLIGLNCKNLFCRSIFAETVRGSVGSTFNHKLKFLCNGEPTTDREQIELLTADENIISKSSWIDLDQQKRTIYGFPLKGNEGKSTYVLRITTFANEIPEKYFVKINVVIEGQVNQYHHQIKLCTSLSIDIFLKELDRRYELASLLSFYLLKAKVDDFYFNKFSKGCIWFSFKNIEDGGKCDLDKLKMLDNQIFMNGEISKDFAKSVNHLTSVKSANLNLSGSCVKPKSTSSVKDLRWVKTVAPILLLVGIVGIPVAISCYVCRGVRRRQNKMRQQQDKLAREDELRLQEQMREYREACGIDDESVSDISASVQTKSRNIPKVERDTFFSKIIQQYMPNVLQDKMDIGKSMLDYTKKESSKKKFFSGPTNPLQKLLDIRSTTITQAQTRAADPLYTTAPGRRRSLAKTAEEMGLGSSSKLATSNLNLLKKIGCSGSQLSVNYVKPSINKELEAWRRLNSTLTKSNALHYFGSGNLLSNGSLNTDYNQCLSSDKYLDRRIPTNFQNKLVRNYPRKTNQPYQYHLSKSNPHLSNSKPMRHPENQNQTKSVSFCDVSENDKTSSSEIISVYRSMPVRTMSTRSCPAIDKITSNQKNKNGMSCNKKSIQTQTSNSNSMFTSGSRRNSLVGSVKSLAVNSKEKLKMSMNSQKTRTKNTCDAATSPIENDSHRIFTDCPKQISERKWSGKDPTLRKQRGIRKSRSFSIPRDNIIPSTLNKKCSQRRSSHNSEHLMRDTYIDQRKKHYPREQYSVDFCPYVENYEDDSSSYISHDCISYDHNNNSVTHPSINLTSNRKQSAIHHNGLRTNSYTHDKKSIFYIDPLDNESNMASFGTSISDDLSYDSIEEEFYDRQNNYQIYTGEPNPPQSLRNSNKVNDTDLSRVRMKRKIFQNQNPLMSNSFDTYFTSEGTATEEHNILTNYIRQKNYIPDTSGIISHNYEERSPITNYHSEGTNQCRNKNSDKHGRYKDDWKNYESGSDVTYMDFGSEYEMKTSTIPLRRRSVGYGANSQFRDQSIFDDPAAFV